MAKSIGIPFIASPMLGAMKTIGARLRFARKTSGFSQESLAKKIGVKQPTISDLESGKSQDSAYWPEIEQATGFRGQWIKSGKGAQRVGDIQTTNYDTALDSALNDISIPQLDVMGSMGPGAVPPDHVDVVRNVVVNRKELEKQCSFTSPQNLQIITGYGRSMKPTFQDGDPLLVDTGVSQVTVDAVYVFEIEGELFIKGLQRLPGGRLRVISHNRDENDPWEIDPFQMESLKIRGRVVMAWNARRL